jgi:ATP-dependent DNA helicase PIF1
VHGQIYYSHDSVDDDTTNNYPLDFLNSITPNGFPPHELKIKKNCPVILLRNLDPHNELYNGTRLVVKAFEDNAIDCEIVNSQHAGKRVFIPRIPLSLLEDISLPFKFKRKQFSIRLSFVMTINKTQGQTIANVGIYLPEPVFSHGQLYIALPEVFHILLYGCWPNLTKTWIPRAEEPRILFSEILYRLENRVIHILI